MACEIGNGKLDAYLDGELTPGEASALSNHMRGCSECAADALQRVQTKRSVAIAGNRYRPSSELRAKIARNVAAESRRHGRWQWKIVALPVFSILILSVAANWYVGRESTRRHRVYSELADLHVAALASANPVDVVSTDRHTVKPWFQGKIPFSFNLPELQGSEFSLLGGRVTYLAQTPGAHLVYQMRKHEISVFIFQDGGKETANLPSGPIQAVSFNLETWTKNGLRYFVVGDVNAEEIQILGKLLRNAG